MQQRIDRRAFLRLTSGVGGALFGSGLARAYSPLVRSVYGASAASDYKALVCVHLRGGNDGFNTLVPKSGPNRTAYAAARADLALEASSLLPLTPATPDPLVAEYGLHPALAGLQARFDEGRMAAVLNVGNLVAPVSKTEFIAGTAALPPGLFSHGDQSAQWLAADVVTETGWGGRVLDALAQSNSSATLPPGISPSGTTPFLVGESTPFFMGPEGAIPLQGFTGTQGLRRLQAMSDLLSLATNSPQAHNFEREYAKTQGEVIEMIEQYATAVAAVPPISTVFPLTPSAKQLELVTQAIQVQQTFGVQRQVFFVEVNGWDTHSGQLAVHAERLAELDQSLAAFQAALDELGRDQAVTTITVSDFGRALLSNGSKGTNHGWGSHAFAIGGAVQGGRFFGAMPDLTYQGPDDAGKGRIIPTTSTEQYAATLAQWMGVQTSGLGALFPHLAQFSSPDLGFMG